MASLLPSFSIGGIMHAVHDKCMQAARCPEHFQATYCKACKILMGLAMLISLLYER